MITAAEFNRKVAVAQELASILAPQIVLHAGDFDEWLRDEDPDTVAYAYDLVESLADVLARPLTRSSKQYRLEGFWLAIYRDMAEEYAQAASYDRECGLVRWPSGVPSYCNRRGA